MKNKNSISFLEAFKPNKKKIIISLIFIILVFAFGCWMTYLSTKLECECAQVGEISYIGDKKMSNGQYCYDSLFIPFDNRYNHTNCCITLQDIILDYIIVLIAGLLFYMVYSISEFFITRQE